MRHAEGLIPLQERCASPLQDLQYPPLLLRFRLILLHKQHYYWTASFLYQDPTPPHRLDYHLRFLLSTIQDLFHCTFPLVIQGPLSLYDYIGILYDTI